MTMVIRRFHPAVVDSGDLFCMTVDLPPCRPAIFVVKRQSLGAVILGLRWVVSCHRTGYLVDPLPHLLPPKRRLCAIQHPNLSRPPKRCRLFLRPIVHGVSKDPAHHTRRLPGAWTHVAQLQFGNQFRFCLISRLLILVLLPGAPEPQNLHRVAQHPPNRRAGDERSFLVPMQNSEMLLDAERCHSRKRAHKLAAERAFSEGLVAPSPSFRPRFPAQRLRKRHDNEWMTDDHHFTPPVLARRARAGSIS